MMYVWLVAGFVLLIKGADYFVGGSSGIAKKFHVPSLIIGLTIVAMGTSAPECAVSIAAAIKGSNEIAISNVIGSNIFNLIVVCGVCALMSPLHIDLKTLKIEFPFAIFAGILLFLMGADALWRKEGTINMLSRAEGLIMVALFAAFLVWMIFSAKKARQEGTQEEYKEMSGIKCLVYIVGGLAAIILGGDLVVDSASAIAAKFGLSQTLIGLTIVAIGTSLPELVTSVVAAKKGEVDMALGNVIGSNIFNILLVLGASAAISPIAVLSESLFDLVLLTVMSAVVYIFAVSRLRIVKIEGAIMLLMYLGYTYYICVR